MVKIVLPNIDVDINVPIIRGIDIKSTKFGGPELDNHGPKLDAGLDIHEP